MTDKEQLQQWIKPGAIIPVTMDATRILVDGLREKLAQPKKEWVGLTKEEIWHMSQFNCGTRGEFARAIDAKLKEKNT